MASINSIRNNPAVTPRQDEPTNRGPDGNSTPVRFAGGENFNVLGQTRFNGSDGARDITWVQGDTSAARQLLEFMAGVGGNFETGDAWLNQPAVDGEQFDVIVQTLLKGIEVSGDERTGPTAERLLQFMSKVFGEPVSKAVEQVLDLRTGAGAALPLNTVAQALSCGRGCGPALEGVDFMESLRERHAQAKSS
jgi:hypothetical protein